jgi:hypothetical protein
MTLFEYLAIAFSLVLSSAAMRLVAGLPHAFDRNRQYWVHSCFLILGLFTVALAFWAYWSYRGATWDLLRFLVALTHLGTVYFLATTIVPENPGGVVAWREYYYSVRIRYFSAVIFLGLTTSINPTLLLAMPLSHPARLAHLFVLVSGIVGASTANSRIHGALAVLACGLSVIFATTVFLRASSLTG